MRVTTGIVMGLMLALSLVPAEAAHCTSYSTSTTDAEKGTVVVELGTPGMAALHYVYYDACQLDCIFSFGFYAESNGIPGLQRQDSRVDDTCHGLIHADLWTG